jgi:hypothetical protein
LFFRNTRWETVFNNSKFLVGVKTSFMLLNERSQSAIDMISVSTTSSRGFRSLRLFSAMVGSEDNTKWKAWLHCWTVPGIMLKNLPTVLMGSSPKQTHTGGMLMVDSILCGYCLLKFLFLWFCLHSDTWLMCSVFMIKYFIFCHLPLFLVTVAETWNDEFFPFCGQLQSLPFVNA